MIEMHPAPALHHLDTPSVNFRDFDFGEASHGYRWINTKRFGLPPDAPDDRALLAALIAHPQFRDTYDGAGVQDRPRHGQWWLERITPGAYQTVDASMATGRIRAWAGRHGDVPQELEARLEEHLYAPIPSATSRYVLGELPEDALHEYGPIHIDFHELVLVDRPRGHPPPARGGGRPERGARVVDRSVLARLAELADARGWLIRAPTQHPYEDDTHPRYEYACPPFAARITVQRWISSHAPGRRCAPPSPKCRTRTSSGPPAVRAGSCGISCATWSSAPRTS
ncbi:hypothetical protein ACFRJ3_13900 [Streptomyces sp. NPDC056696]|uniref:hypothetical protein n=1 Tax=Streptomyces sp. NPDC056696 TaxID=3345914 RepID=UPI0036B7F5C9